MSCSTCRTRGRDVRAFVTSLEDWLIATLARFGVAGERHPGQIGIFVNGAKIASIGVRVRRWVSLHGVSLNVDPALEHFSGIVPCGLTDMKVTSLAALGAETDMATIDQALRAAFQRGLWPSSHQRQRSDAMTLKPDGGAPPSSVIVTAVTLASRRPVGAAPQHVFDLRGGPGEYRLDAAVARIAHPAIEPERLRGVMGPGAIIDALHAAFDLDRDGPGFSFLRHDRSTHARGQ